MMTYSDCVSTTSSFGYTNLLSSTTCARLLRQSSNDRIFRVRGMSNGLCFKKEISVPFTVWNDGVFIAQFENGPIIITATANDFMSLKKVFENEVWDAWEYFAQEDDSEMTAGAIAVKRWLHDNIIVG